MPYRSFGPLLVCALLLILPASASAYYEHVVAPGETLTSVAATDGLSVDALAAANGLSPYAELIAGTPLQIPPQTAATVAYTSSATTGSPAATTSVPVDTSDSGGYVVQPGDTLTAIAARDGTSVAELAAVNGLDPNGILLSGSALTLPAPGSYGSSGSAGSSGTTEYVSTSTSSGTAAGAESQPVGAPAEGTAGAPPYPTAETVSGSQIAGIASANGVSPSLAEAIGWQESGWNNALTSPAGAVGVMQILPGTWNWINRTLTAGTQLAPASAADNVRGGVLLLRALENSTGSDSMAAAGYYQGLSSVQQNGMYSDTQQYVNDVMALKARFGGG